MADRLVLLHTPTEDSLSKAVYSALKDLSKREPQASPGTQSPLENCCKLLSSGGALATIVQIHVQDPDFLAEFSAYYSRQFLNVQRFCTRLHFFSHWVDGNSNVLRYIDQVPKEAYLGFITLRPVIKSPIGATIIASRIVTGYVRSKDNFPVHIAGAEFKVSGTPFMQQDNAVGACAQASIWMALRTLRKREGDRAHDPAQITDAATRYFVSGRTRPNRQGLTQLQMTEAIRAAGYSPHMIPLGIWHSQGAPFMPANQVPASMTTIHAYIESDIPVILILFPPTGGHAVVAIGHTWDATASLTVRVAVSISRAATATSPPSIINLNFVHTASWVPSLLIHNDNTGPYRSMPPASIPTEYCFEHAAYAIPLLPVDVFMSGEEASAVANETLADVFQELLTAAILTEQEVQALAATLALRLLLVEKRKLRRWAAEENMAAELRDRLRLMEMPKRVWVLEVHLASNYANQQNGNTPHSLVGLILIDPTGDIPQMSMLLAYFNLPALINSFQHGSVVTWDADTGVPKLGLQTTEVGPIKPLRI